MASRIDQKFIDNLSNFSKSLENIVELLKEQSKASNDESRLKFASNIDGDQLKRIVKDLEKLNSKTSKIEKTNTEILREVKSIKQAKEKGMFDKVDDKNNKKQITDGVKTVVLIAAGVLAVGMAFKIIGKVDVLSVVALSIGILLLGKTFKELSTIKGLDYKKVFLLSSILPIMAVAVMVSSHILKQSAQIGLMQALSIGFVGIALSLAMYGLSKVVKKFNPKDLAKYMLLPIIIPIIAMSIVAASWAFQLIKPLGMMQVLTALFVSITIAIAAIAISMMVKFLKDVSYESVLLATSMIPLIAGGIVLASWIFQALVPIKNPLQFLLTTVLIGVALALFAITVKIIGGIDPVKAELATEVAVVLAVAIVMTSWIFQALVPINDPLKFLLTTVVIGVALFVFSLTVKMLSGIDPKKALQASGVAVVLSAAIVLTSWILSLGKFDSSYPDWKWSLGVGVSLVAFSAALYILSKVGIQSALMGSLIVLLVAGTITAASWILSLGKFDSSYPDWKWSLGVGVSLVAFGLSMVVFGAIAMSGVGAIAMALGAALVLLVAGTIVATSYILSKGKYSGGPSLEWAGATGLSMLAFGTGMILLGALAITGIGALAIIAGGKMMSYVAQSIVDASFILSKGRYVGGPTKEWSEGIGLALSSFANGLAAMNNSAGLLSSIFGGSDIVGNISSLANGIVAAATVLNKAGNIYTTYPSKEWSEGVGNSISSFANGISAINNSKGFFGGNIEDNITAIANGLVAAATVLNKAGNIYSTYPSKEWAEGSSASITIFAENINKLSRSELNNFEEWSTNLASGVVAAAKKFNEVKDWSHPDEAWVNTFSALSNLNITNSTNDIYNLAKAVVELSKSLDSVNVDNIEKLSKIVSNLNVLGVVDDNKLNQVLTVLKNRKDDLKVSFETGGSVLNNSSNQNASTSSVKVNKNDTNLNNTKSPNSKLEEQMEQLLTKVDSILEVFNKTKTEEDVHKK